MRKLLAGTSVLLLCGAANVAFAAELTDRALTSRASAVVDWKYDLTTQPRTLSAKSLGVDAADNNGEIKIGSHALSPVHTTSRSISAANEPDLLNAANATNSPGLATNTGLSHSLSAVPVSTESSRLLPVQ